MKENNNYFSWTILSETEAVKRCDKSFFHYKETGIPHEIGWFFDAENLMPGDDREITILFGNSEYNMSSGNKFSDYANYGYINGRDIIFICETDVNKADVELLEAQINALIMANTEVKKQLS